MHFFKLGHATIIISLPSQPAFWHVTWGSLRFFLAGRGGGVSGKGKDSTLAALTSGQSAGESCARGRGERE